MAKESKILTEDMSAAVIQNVEQARGSLENYFQFFQKSVSGLPGFQTDLGKKIQSYAEQNLASASGHIKKLSEAKDFQDFISIQTEFLQTQLRVFGEQARDLGEIATKTMIDAFKSKAA
jgi:hypothetical protein